jgi:hypothetical protein
VTCQRRPCKFIDRLGDQDETTILKAFVAWVKKNGWS